MPQKRTPKAKANGFNPYKKTFPRRVGALTAARNKDHPYAAYASFNPPAMLSAVRTHLKSLRQSISGPDEANYRYLAARAAAYEVQNLQLRDDAAAAEERANRRLYALKRNPSLAILSPYYQCLGRGYEADQELLKLKSRKIWLDRIIIVCSNRFQLFQRGELSEIKEFLATEVNEMQSTKDVCFAEELSEMKLREIWPTCEDHWERLMRVQLVWVTLRIAHGMETATVKYEVDGLTNCPARLDLGKASEDDTEEERHGSSMFVNSKVDELMTGMEGLGLGKATVKSEVKELMTDVESLDLGKADVNSVLEDLIKQMAALDLGKADVKSQMEKLIEQMAGLDLGKADVKSQMEKLIEQMAGLDLGKADVNSEVEKLIKQLEGLDLGRAGEDDTEEEKHEKALSFLQDLLDRLQL